MISKDFYSFPEIADTVAREQCDKHWRSHTDEYLGALVGDFWRGRFHKVLHRSAGFAIQEPDSTTREVVWKLLGTARPPAFHDVPPDTEPDWEKLARAKPEDYGYGLSRPGIRDTVLAQLFLPKADALDWISSRGKAVRPQGRPREYAWDDFFREVVLIANSPDGLPEMMADLERQMQEWCATKWDQEPTESVIREKLSPIYAQLKAGK